MSADEGSAASRKQHVSRPRPVRSTAVTLMVLGTLCLTLLFTGLLGCGSRQTSSDPGATGDQETVTITDDAGRQVTIPVQIDRVFGAGPAGTNFIYTLAPDLLIGWNITPTDQEKQYIPEEYRTMSGLGGWYGKNTTGNVEEIIKLGPDIVFSVGDVDEAAVSDAERAQELLGVPVVMVDAELTKTGDAYRFVGQILGLEERAEQLAGYCDQVIHQAQQNSAKLAAEDRISIYYAEGGKGLHTDPEGSNHTQVFTLVAARNVADVELQQGYGMSPVSLEQVIAWDPEVIMVASDPAGETNVYEQITEGADWATIQAVKDSRVYEIPHGPFDWIDRPYSIGRILGVLWVGDLLYPDLYDLDMQAETKEFYELFYHFDLTDAQMQELMEHAVPTR